MGKTRIGFMGFGRIGRNVFRLLDSKPDLEAAAIADVANPEALGYLLKFDTIYGRYPRAVSYRDGAFQIGDDRVPFVSAAQPGAVDWGALGVDIVIDATGKYRTRGWCEKHLSAGAERVILASTPELLGEMPVVLTGVNDGDLGPDARIVALGSNTSNAIAPVLQVLDEELGIEHGLFSTVHAITTKVRLADVPGEDLRTGRAARENIIPTSTNSPQILEHVLPSLRGKLSALALNVPVPDGSAVDLVAFVRKAADRDRVNGIVRAAAESRFAGILDYATDPIVSSDVRGSAYSGVFDSLATMVLEGTTVKVVVWFDNGWGYAARILDTIERMAAMPSGRVQS